MKINAACDCRVGFHRTGCSRKAEWRVEYEVFWGLFTRVKLLCSQCLPYGPHEAPDGATITLVEN